jgi:hypothetical protein
VKDGGFSVTESVSVVGDEGDLSENSSPFALSNRAPTFPPALAAPTLLYQPGGGEKGSPVIPRPPA